MQAGSSESQGTGKAADESEDDRRSAARGSRTRRGRITSSEFSRRSGAFLITDARFQLVRAAQDFGTAQDTQRARDQLSRTHRPAANSPSFPRLAHLRRPREASTCSSWTHLPTFRFACSGRRRGETSLVHSPAVDTPSRRSNLARLACGALLACARLRSTARDPPSAARLVPAQSPHSGRATRRTPRAPTFTPASCPLKTTS